MKIVSHIKSLMICLIAAPFFFAEASSGYAADTNLPVSSPAANVAPAPPPAVPATTVAATATAAPSSAPNGTQAAVASASSQIPLPPPPATDAVAPAGITVGGKPPAGNNLNAAENKLSDSVRDVVKKMDRPDDDVTLDDLNSARQAIEKIEILTDIEKHLQELDKVRHERQKDTGMASMIPASALQPTLPPPVQAPIQSSFGQDQQLPLPPPKPVKEVVDVVQISGGDGHYTAVIKMTGDESKTVHVGDDLPDGSLVAEIQPAEIVLEHKGVKRTMHVKNVDTVFGNSF